MTIRGVTIGDKFKKGNHECEVVDFYEVKSLDNNQVIYHLCIAKIKTALCNGVFEVPFATVIRYKLTNK